MTNDRNAAVWVRAQNVLVGGVNSPVRASKSVGMEVPLHIARAEGAWLTDLNGKEYLDFVGSWGPMILGHRPHAVCVALADQMSKGISYGTCTEEEVLWAEWITERLPWVDKVRMTCSGTEAGMTAIRLARAYTDRPLIVKFNGCYHGHSDALLVKAGSGALTVGQPDSAGVAMQASQTVLVEFNDVDQLTEAFNTYGADIAAVIMEIVPGNMGFIRPAPSFLQKVVQLCQEAGSLLIADEVMTGFRVGLQGACGVYDINPDIVMLGKVVSGGLPAAAIGGRDEIMDRLSPLGDVYQAGTLSGNPLAVVAGLETFKQLDEPFFERLGESTQAFIAALKGKAAEFNLPFSADSLGGMFGLQFSERMPTSFTEAVAMNKGRYAQFFVGMFAKGVYFAPSPFEAGFFSAAHGEREVDFCLKAAEEVWKAW